VAPSDQCSNWSSDGSVQNDELPADGLNGATARLVTIQAGADDIDFESCLEYELTKFGFLHSEGTDCVSHGHVTSTVTARLNALRTALASEIDTVSTQAAKVAVLNYYQAIPAAAEFRPSSIFPSSGTVDPVCWGLSHNLNGARADSLVIQAALNATIGMAVSDARSAGKSNVVYVDLTNLENTHEMCTGNPAIFSGVPMSTSTFDTELAKSVLGASTPGIDASIWRTAHPNTFGQRDISNAVVAAVRS
jgi:hypothetical protein